jgi:hypothetical protein
MEPLKALVTRLSFANYVKFLIVAGKVRVSWLFCILTGAERAAELH